MRPPTTGPEPSASACPTRARAERPDVILLDLVMPRTGGAAVLEALRADDATAGIPVIVVTAKALEPDERDTVRRLTFAIIDKRELSRDRLPDLVRRARDDRRASL